jgi:hypothetical protein
MPQAFQLTVNARGGPWIGKDVQAAIKAVKAGEVSSATAR